MLSISNKVKEFNNAVDVTWTGIHDVMFRTAFYLGS